MSVALDVCEDDANLDVYAEIVATRPGSRDGGRVRVADTGGLTWQRDHWPADETARGEGDHPGEATGPQALALDIAMIVADATRQGIPGPVALSSAT
jgi:hypothetical protein